MSSSEATVCGQVGISHLPSPEEVHTYYFFCSQGQVHPKRYTETHTCALLMPTTAARCPGQLATFLWNAFKNLVSIKVKLLPKVRMQFITASMVSCLLQLIQLLREAKASESCFLRGKSRCPSRWVLRGDPQRQVQLSESSIIPYSQCSVNIYRTCYFPCSEFPVTGDLHCFLAGEGWPWLPLNLRGDERKT